MDGGSHDYIHENLKLGGTLTWHFRLENTRGVSWTAGPAFACDAARINLPAGKTALAMSVYPAEAQGRERWGRSTEYMKHAVEEFSRRWYPYPWSAAINVAGPAAIPWTRSCPSSPIRRRRRSCPAPTR